MMILKDLSEILIKLLGLVVTPLIKHVNFRHIIIEFDNPTVRLAGYSDYVLDSCYVGEVIIEFTMSVKNKSNSVDGIKNCNIYLKYGDKKVNLDSNIKNILDKYERTYSNKFYGLMNIPPGETKDLEYKEIYFGFPQKERLKEGYELYLEYQYTGGKKVYKKRIK